MNIRALLIPMFLAPTILWSAGEKNAGHVLRCRTFAIGKAPEGLFVKSEGKYSPLSVSCDHIGKSFRTETDEGIVFYKKVPPTTKPQGAGGERDEYKAFVVCKPDGAGPQLVFFIPAAENTWKAFAKSDADGNFPAGTRLVFNLSEHAVAFDFGGTKLALKSHQSGLLRAPVKTDQGVAPVRITRQNASENWMPVSNTAWLHQADARKIVLIYPSGTDKISITSIQDTVEPKDKKELGTALKK